VVLVYIQCMVCMWEMSSVVLVESPVSTVLSVGPGGATDKKTAGSSTFAVWRLRKRFMKHRMQHPKAKSAGVIISSRDRWRLQLASAAVPKGHQPHSVSL